MNTENLKGKFTLHEPGIGFNDDHQPIQTTDFSFDEIERALDEAEEITGPEMRGELSVALRLLLERIIDVRGLHSRAASRAIGRRLIALMWIISPATFGGISLSQLAQRIGVSKQILSKYSSEFSDRFNIETTAQMRGRSGKHRQRLRLRKKRPPGGRETAGRCGESETMFNQSATSTSPESEAGR